MLDNVKAHHVDGYHSFCIINITTSTTTFRGITN